MKKDIAIAYINRNSLTGIKAGFNRPNFLDIWMVVVDQRIFARSWGFAERSWYNYFLQNPAGQIKCGENIFTIKAQLPEDIAGLTEKINQAYLAKYNSEHNRAYAKAIIGQAHINKTMEFVVEEG